jgi:hypothetical protein
VLTSAARSLVRDMAWHDGRKCPRVSRMQLTCKFIVPGWADAGRMELQHRDGILLHAAPPCLGYSLSKQIRRSSRTCRRMIIDAFI